MNFDKIIKPLHFNENGVAIGSARFKIEKGMNSADRNLEYYHASAQHLNGSIAALGTYYDEQSAINRCNDYNAKNIFANLLTIDANMCILTNFSIK